MTKKSHYPEANQNLDFAKMEEEVLRFWQEEKIFEKSVEIRNFSEELDEDNVSPVLDSCALKDHVNCRHSSEARSEFVFYDGPPFANGLPHYGHLLTGFIKDIFARFQSMKGKKTERKFGWDTHGLPVEMEVEKELTKQEGKPISGQIAIQEYGIEKFNDACRKSVMRYADDWENYVTRQGRFVDFKNSYKTMDVNYMESTIWAFKQLFDKGLIYEKLRVVPYSWACQTPLSNFETRMDNAYRRKESKAVTVKFELEKVPEFLRNSKFFQTTNITKISLVAWTTTPWTLPSNLGLAIGKEIIYAGIQTSEDELCILSKDSSLYNDLINCDFAQKNGVNQFILNGLQLVNLNYKPLFPYLTSHEKVQNNSKVFSVLHGDFVSTEEGTGIVHMAPGFGEDDQMLCEANLIPIICPVDEGGKFTSEIFDLPELSLKTRHVFDTNDDIIKYLKATGAWVKTEQYLHNYPHCWRTDTPLIYKAVSSWYVKVTDIKDRMVELNSGKKLFKAEKVPTTIETPRLLGRQVTMEDFDPLFSQIFSDPEVRKFYYFAHHQICNEEQARSQIEYYLKQAALGLPRFYLTEKTSGKFVGIAGLCFYDPAEENFEKGDVEISYALAQSSWGRGYATEIGKALVDFSFENYPIDHICAATVSDNFGSQKILDKLAFTLVLKEWNNCAKGRKDGNYEEFYYEKKREGKSPFELTEGGINWIPNHIKDGQFGKWLEGARDWSITRNRFWGCPVPVWRSESGKIKTFGSIAELEKVSGKKITNLHRPFIDQITFEEDGEKYQRVTDVLDCWFESGSMPYAQVHYPFENKEWFEKNFPADFITEYVAQTRGWFYTMLVLSVALFDKIPFKNVICHGTILDEKSQKLSKRLKNYADPLEIFSSIGSDAMRFYMISQPVMKGQELRIDKDGKALRDTLRLSIKPLINAYNFFCLYANADGILAKRIDFKRDFNNVLDRYILAKLKSAVSKIDEAMENYDTVIACEEFNQFFEALNNWYIRRSRGRFWKKIENEKADSDKQDAYDTLYTCLLLMCEAAAPLLPFTSEFVWKNLNQHS